MSSHHFVKEKQEPSLLISSADYYNDEYVGQLLEWCPIVIVPDFLVSFIASKGIKIDIVLQIGFSNKDLNDIYYTQVNSRIIEIENKENWVQETIEILVQEKHNALNIIGDGLYQLQRFFIKKIQIVVYSNKQKQYSIPSVFNKWYKAGMQIEIEKEDLQNVLQLKNLKPNPDFIFDVQEDGTVFIKSTKSIILKEFL